MASVDRRVILAIIIFSVIAWYPTRHIPFHWDSAAFVINAAKNLHETNFIPLIATGSEFAHPPLYPALIAFSWKIINCSLTTDNCKLLLPHVTILPFFILLLAATYFLGKKLHSLTVGITSTILVATTPFILAELGMPYIDLVAGSLAACSLTLWLYHKPKLSIALLSLAVLTKFTVMLILIPIISSYFHPKSKFKNLKSSLPFILTPLYLILFWLLYHHTVTGWWLTIPGRDTVLKLNPISFLNSVKFIAYVLFIRQGRWLMSLFSLISLWVLYHQKRVKRLLNRDFALLFTAICSLLTIYALTGEFIPRYAIAILPAFYVIATSYIYKAFPKPFNHLTILAILFLFVTSLHPKIPDPNAYQFRINEDLSYRDHIIVGQQLGQFLQLNYPGATIIGSFPQRYQLQESYQGYVSIPLHFYECDSYTSLTSPTSPTSPTLIIIHPYHYSQLACQDILSTYPHTLIKEFNTNQIWIQVYQLN